MILKIASNNHVRLLIYFKAILQKGEEDKFCIDPDNICGKDESPYLSTEDPNCIKDLNTTCEQRDESVLTFLGPQAITGLVKLLQWRSLFLFYETSTEVEISDLVDSLSKEGVLLSLFNIDQEESLHNRLQQIYQLEVNIHHRQEINIVVVCKFSCARYILRTANKFDATNLEHKTLLKMFSRWLIVVYGHSQGVSSALQSCAFNLDNVAIIAFPGISGNGTGVFNKVLQSVLLEILKEELSGSHLKFKKAVIDQLETVKTLTGKLYPPFVIKKEINGTIEYEGFCMDLLKELATKLNFTYTVTEPSDGKWGDYEDMNLTYNGLVGQLQRQEVDMIAAPLSTSLERNKVMDFSYPFRYEYTSVIFKKTDVNAKKWRTLVDPFKWEVLVCIGFALPIMTVLAFLIEKYNPYYETPDHSTERDRNGGLHKWHSSIWYMYGALLCQGGVHLPNSTAGRTLVSSWWLFCIIIVGIYSGNLIAFLTVTKEKPPFETLAEMIKLKGSYRWGTLSDTIFATVLLKSDNPIYKAIGDGIRDFNKTDPNVLSTDPEVHIGKVKKGQYAWIGDKTSIELAMAKECSLTSIKEEFLPLKDGFGFVKGSPHTPIFTKHYICLDERSILLKHSLSPVHYESLIINECVNSSVPEYDVILGNQRDVGKQIKYKTAVVKCLPTGFWSEFAKGVRMFASMSQTSKCLMPLLIYTADTVDGCKLACINEYDCLSTDVWWNLFGKAVCNMGSVTREMILDADPQKLQNRKTKLYTRILVMVIVMKMSMMIMMVMITMIIWCFVVSDNDDGGCGEYNNVDDNAGDDYLDDGGAADYDSVCNDDNCHYGCVDSGDPDDSSGGDKNVDDDDCCGCDDCGGGGFDDDVTHQYVKA
ncbi:uncharacterized protein LOC123556009 [Mercenaria mercenaria]|uniref:uncharacterized protein LOC123556009 n=1 Tax=Mercenaria mercenaria TaxID=6596 RepID=UPI00234F3067|nr:uncharacterized protein LOC123556009 [Mercenaria mercenaria]